MVQVLVDTKGRVLAWACITRVLVLGEAIRYFILLWVSVVILLSGVPAEVPMRQRSLAAGTIYPFTKGKAKPAKMYKVYNKP